jgi:fatty acid desaturase
MSSLEKLAALAVWFFAFLVIAMLTVAGLLWAYSIISNVRVSLWILPVLGLAAVCVLALLVNFLRNSSIL